MSLFKQNFLPSLQKKKKKVQLKEAEISFISLDSYTCLVLKKHMVCPSVISICELVTKMVKQLALYAI